MILEFILLFLNFSCGKVIKLYTPHQKESHQKIETTDSLKSELPSLTSTETPSAVAESISAPAVTSDIPSKTEPVTSPEETSLKVTPITADNSSTPSAPMTKEAENPTNLETSVTTSSLVWDSEFQQDAAEEVCNHSNVPPRNHCLALFKYCGNCHGSWVTSMSSLSQKKDTILQHLQGTIDPMPKDRWQIFYDSPEGKALIEWFKAGNPLQ